MGAVTDSDVHIDNAEPDFDWLEKAKAGNATFMFPHDIRELDRQQTYHYIIRFILQSHIAAPIPKSVKRILDVGCGSGIWAMEIAAEYPKCEVVGLDVATDFPDSTIPRNCKFVIHDIRNGLPFPDGHFDLVHMRSMGYTTINWENTLREMYRVTAPGGWIQLVENDSEIQIEDEKAALAKLTEWVHIAQTAIGSQTFVARKFASFLKDVGCINIVDRHYDVPCAKWGGAVGDLMYENVVSLLHGLQRIVLSAIGITKEEYDEAVQNCMKRVEDNKGYIRAYISYGQKPGNP